jgi:hypothetical protein
MSERKDWIYARVLRKGPFIFPRRPYWFGWVEFVPLNQVDAQLARAVANSAAAHGLSEIAPDDRYHVLVRTIVLDSTVRDVEKEAVGRFREAIDIFTHRATPLPSDFDLLKAGALLDILADVSAPLLPPWKEPELTGALLDDRAVHPAYILNLLLAAPNGFGQLGMAYARSQHWKMLAGDAATTAEKVLLHWMAVETLCSVQVGDNPIPNLMYASGFPIGRRSRSATALAKSIPRHGMWRKRILKLLEAVRRTRNGIVHEGHRDVDVRSLLGPQDETDSLLFLRLSLRCLDGHAEEKLSRGSAPLTVLWEVDSIASETMQQNASWIVKHLEGEFSR